MTEYVKEDDYTLKVVQTLGQKKNFLQESTRSDSYKYPGEQVQSLTRLFNFCSCQIITIYDNTLWSGAYHAAASAATSQMHVQNFSDLPSLSEVKFCHGKLVEQGGKPPPWKDIEKNSTPADRRMSMLKTPK
ncbi:MAG: hypothetical protein OXT65_04435 [Alphaproteobacteria bacterium]|nr:hypothetical protein [Alphaproteobacteria bacterium]